MHIIYSNINYYYLEIVSGKPKRKRITFLDVPVATLY